MEPRVTFGRRLAALVLGLLFVVPAMPAGAKGETIALESPNGGETYSSGSRVTLEWTTSDTTGGVRAYFSTNGGATYPNFIGAFDNGIKSARDWDIPAGLNSTTVRVRLEWWSDGLPPVKLASDESDRNFTVRPAVVLRFTEAPASVSAGRYYLLRWSLYDGIQSVRSLDLQLRARPNSTWTAWQDLGGAYAGIPPRQGGLWWLPPYYAEAQLQLRVRALSSTGGVLALNDSAEIHIKSPVVRLTRPNGGETLVGGRPYSIEWIAPDPDRIITSMGFSYSTDGGATWHGITEGQPNIFRYTWNVPAGIDSSRVLVNITALYIEWSVLAEDRSDGFCTIISDPNVETVTLEDPNPDEPGGLIVGGGERHTIRWSITGSASEIESFRIHLSTDNGTAWENIQNATNTATTKVWTAPMVDTESALVRIELVKTDSTRKYSQSANPFRIYTTVPFNRCPVARAGPDREEFEGSTVSLYGSASSDPDGDPIRFKWRQVSPPEFPARLVNDSTDRPFFVPDILDFSVYFIFELEVTDGMPASDALQNLSYVTITVLPRAPTITSFYPPRVFSGMNLTIRGTHLKGAQVFIGDALAATVLTSPTPENADPDTQYWFDLPETVPHRPAPVTVRTRAGESSTSGSLDVYPVPQFCFANGFRFDNQAEYFLSYPDWVWQDGNYHDTFGDDVWFSIWVCIGLPVWTPWSGWECLGYEWEQPLFQDPLAALYYGVAYCWIARNGECFGISTAALEFYHDRLREGDFNASATRAGQLDYGGELERHIKYMHGSQVSAECLHWFVATHLANLEPSVEPLTGLGAFLGMVRAAVSSGELGIISVMDGTDGHAVVPYLVEDVDATHTRIYVYDCNRPYYSNRVEAEAKMLTGDAGDNFPPYIEIDRSGLYWTWRFVMEYNVTWGGNMGMIFIPYGILTGGRSLPTTPEGAIDFIMGSATAAVEDGAGRRVAIEDNGSITATIPGAKPLPISQGPAYNGMGYYLPKGNYTTRIKGISDGKYNWSLLCEGNTSLSLENAGVRNGTRDTVNVTFEDGNPLMGRLSLRTTDARKGYSASLIKKMGPEPVRPRERVYRILNATLHGDSEAVINTTPDYNSLVFWNNGPHSFSFDVEFDFNVVTEDVWNSSSRPTGLPNVTRKGITIGPYQTLVIRPDHWLDLMNATVIVEGEGLAKAPDPPRNLKASPSKDRVSLTWNAPASDGGSPIAAYVVMRGDSASNLTLLATLGNVTSYADTAVKAGTKYYYAVLARNLVGGSNATAAVSAAIPKKEEPAGGVPMWLILLIVVVIAVAVVGVAAAMRRKRPPAGGPIPPPPGQPGVPPPPPSLQRPAPPPPPAGPTSEPVPPPPG